MMRLATPIPAQVIGSGFGDGSLGRCAVGDIAGDGDAVDIDRHFGSRFGVDVKKRNLGAGRGQHARRGSAEA
jgi:hypothetical protein